MNTFLCSTNLGTWFTLFKPQLVKAKHNWTIWNPHRESSLYKGTDTSNVDVTYTLWDSVESRRLYPPQKQVPEDHQLGHQISARQQPLLGHHLLPLQPPLLHIQLHQPPLWCTPIQFPKCLLPHIYKTKMSDKKSTLKRNNKVKSFFAGGISWRSRSTEAEAADKEISLLIRSTSIFRWTPKSLQKNPAPVRKPKQTNKTTRPCGDQSD